MLDDGVGEFGWQGREPRAVFRGGHADRVAGQLAFGEPVGVLAAAFDQRVNQGVAVVRLDAGQVTDVVTVVAHRPSSATALAGVSSPTALPMRACLVG